MVTIGQLISSNMSHATLNALSRCYFNVKLYGILMCNIPKAQLIKKWGIKPYTSCSGKHFNQIYHTTNNVKYQIAAFNDT